MLRSPVLALIVALGCHPSKTPAPTPTPDDAASDSSLPAPDPEQVFKAAEPCASEVLDACADACNDIECLEWCAGADCHAVLAGLDACIDEANDAYVKANPRPEYEYDDTPSADEPEDTHEPDEESFDLVDEWEIARNDALEARWEEICVAKCKAKVLVPTRDEPHFCDEAIAVDYQHWDDLLTPVAAGSPKGAITQMIGHSSMFQSSGLVTKLWGSSIELVDSASLSKNDRRRGPVQAMIGRASSQLDACIPNVDKQGVPFEFVIDFDESGAAVRSKLVDGEQKLGVCVGARVTAALWLPPRVADEIRSVHVRATVRPEPDFGTAGADFGTGFGGLGTRGTSERGTVGGLGGLGTRGSGRAGGRTAEDPR